MKVRYFAKDREIHEHELEASWLKTGSLSYYRLPHKNIKSLCLLFIDDNNDTVGLVDEQGHIKSNFLEGLVDCENGYIIDLHIKKNKLESNIDLDLDDATILFLAEKAHEKDITLNKYINEIIKIYIDQCEMDREMR